MVGRINAGTYFLIGSSYSATVTEGGVLELLYWDSNYEDNDGSVIVDVAVTTDVMCSEPYCGDGYVDEGEECDDGNDDNSDSCRNDCTERSGGGTSSSIPGDGD